MTTGIKLRQKANIAKYASRNYGNFVAFKKYRSTHYRKQNERVPQTVSFLCRANENRSQDNGNRLLPTPNKLTINIKHARKSSTTKPKPQPPATKFSYAPQHPYRAKPIYWPMVGTMTRVNEPRRFAIRRDRRRSTPRPPCRTSVFSSCRNESCALSAPLTAPRCS